jgi:pimeloyl-ACP methyl ester carboxylesterase
MLMKLLLARTPRAQERLIFDLTARLEPDLDHVVNGWIAIRQSRPVRRSNALRQLIAAARFRAPRTVTVPTLLLASAGDGLVDGRCSMTIARRWKCALAIHPTAGHDLPLDDGEWVAKQVHDWLETLDQGAPGAL